MLNKKKKRIYDRNIIDLSSEKTNSIVSLSNSDKSSEFELKFNEKDLKNITLN